MNHWKDRDPQETIQIIKNFFNEKGFHIKKTTTTKINNGYWTHIELWNENNTLLLAKANGKGITEELCEASGLGELYERYCGLQPDTCEIVPQTLSYDWLDYIYPLVIANNGGQLLTSKFLNIKDQNDKIYLSREALGYLFGSTGLSCGNSFPEAVLQATCELCERYVITELLTHKESFGRLIETNENQELGLTFEYFDLSLDFNMPVIALRVTDKKNFAYGYAFGCHPIMDIAKERCITEFFQGAIVYMDKIDLLHSRLIHINEEIEDYGNFANIKKVFSDGSGFIPYNKFNSQKSDRDSGCFLNDYSIVNNNSDLLLFLINTIKVNLYVSTISQCDKMYAVHVYSPDLENNKQVAFSADIDLDRFKLEIEYNALLKDAIKNRDIKKAMSMVQDAIDFNIPMYDGFYRTCAFPYQLTAYLVALLGLYKKDKALYSQAINDIAITGDILYKLVADDFNNNMELTCYLDYII